MATTKPDKVGRTRTKMAELLNKTFPEWHFEPEDLNSNDPYHGSHRFDGCSWSGWGYLKSNRNMNAHICSWNTMTEILKHGINIVSKDFLDAEVCVDDSYLLTDTMTLS